MKLNKSSIFVCCILIVFAATPAFGYNIHDAITQQLINDTKSTLNLNQLSGELLQALLTTAQKSYEAGRPGERYRLQTQLNEALEKKPFFALSQENINALEQEKTADNPRNINEVITDPLIAKKSWYLLTNPGYAWYKNEVIPQYLQTHDRNSYTTIRKLFEKADLFNNVGFRDIPMYTVPLGESTTIHLPK